MEEEMIDGLGVKHAFYNDFVRRYFEQFVVNKGKKDEQFINVHTNGIITFGLTANNQHLSKEIVAVKNIKNFGGATGKKKTGALRVNELEHVIEFEFKDGSTARISSMVRGKIIEFNERVLKDASILMKYPETEGYLGIFMMDKSGSREYSAQLEEKHYKKYK